MIHPTAILGEHVKLSNKTSIGPYSVVEGNVEIGENCRIGPHCHISGSTRIGSGTQIHAGAVIGDEPQDHRYDDNVSFTEIGENCVLREYVTVHRGALDRSSTIIEDNVMLMAFVHIGHNCHIESEVNMANMTVLGGHVSIGKGAFISASAVVHQFVGIGRYAMVSANARVNKDVPPYCMLAEGDFIYGANVLALRRAGFSVTIRNAIKETIKLFFSCNLNPKEALAKINKSYGHLDEIKHFIDFIQASKRGCMASIKKRGKGKNQ